jgi:hypothetical protein
MNKYIKGMVYGLPKPSRMGWNTSPKSFRKDKEYIHKVEMKGYTYFKVHLKRQDVSKIKYFKKFKEAKLFVDLLRENKYL